jgi:hypothetical protein
MGAPSAVKAIARCPSYPYSHGLASRSFGGAFDRYPGVSRRHTRRGARSDQRWDRGIAGESADTRDLARRGARGMHKWPRGRPASSCTPMGMECTLQAWCPMGPGKTYLAGKCPLRIGSRQGAMHHRGAPRPGIPWGSAGRPIGRVGRLARRGCRNHRHHTSTSDRAVRNRPPASRQFRRRHHLHRRRERSFPRRNPRRARRTAHSRVMRCSRGLSLATRSEAFCPSFSPGFARCNAPSWTATRMYDFARGLANRGRCGRARRR